MYVEENYFLKSRITPWFSFLIVLSTVLLCLGGQSPRGIQLSSCVCMCVCVCMSLTPVSLQRLKSKC